MATVEGDSRGRVEGVGAGERELCVIRAQNFSCRWQINKVTARPALWNAYCQGSYITISTLRQMHVVEYKINSECN